MTGQVVVEVPATEVYPVTEYNKAIYRRVERYERQIETLCCRIEVEMKLLR